MNEINKWIKETREERKERKTISFEIKIVIKVEFKEGDDEYQIG